METTGWRSVGMAAVGDEHGPIYLDRRRVGGIEITRSRRRGTRTVTEYTRDGDVYDTLRAALEARNAAKTEIECAVCSGYGVETTVEDEDAAERAGWDRIPRDDARDGLARHGSEREQEVWRCPVCRRAA